MVNLSTKFEVSSYGHSTDIIEPPRSKICHVTLTTPLSGVIFIPVLTLDIAYLCTKFHNSSFSHFKDTIGAPINFNGSRDHDHVHTPFRGVLASAGTSCDQPLCQTCSLCLCPLRRYKRWCTM